MGNSREILENLRKSGGTLGNIYGASSSEILVN